MSDDALRIAFCVIAGNDEMVFVRLDFRISAAVGIKLFAEQPGKRHTYLLGSFKRADGFVNPYDKLIS